MKESSHSEPEISETWAALTAFIVDDLNADSVHQCKVMRTPCRPKHGNPTNIECLKNLKKLSIGLNYQHRRLFQIFHMGPQWFTAGWTWYPNTSTSSTQSIHMLRTQTYSSWWIDTQSIGCSCWPPELHGPTTCRLNIVIIRFMWYRYSMEALVLNVMQPVWHLFDSVIIVPKAWRHLRFRT